MAVALGFGGQANKNTPVSGSTGGGSIQPRLQLNGQGQAVTDGSGGFLDYLQGLMKQPAVAPANQAPLQSPVASEGIPGTTSTAGFGQGSGGKSAAGSALAGQAAGAALGGGL